MTHYYCAIFHFSRGSGQWKMCCCCSCDHCCRPVLERRGMTARTKNGINEVQNSREYYLSLKYDWATRLNFLQVGVQTFHDVLETLTYTITKTINNMREIVTPSRRLSILLSWPLETFSEDLNFSFWASLLLSRQTVNGWILRNTVQELFNIFDIAQ